MITGICTCLQASFQILLYHLSRIFTLRTGNHLNSPLSEKLLSTAAHTACDYTVDSFL